MQSVPESLHVIGVRDFPDKHRKDLSAVPRGTVTHPQESSPIDLPLQIPADHEDTEHYCEAAVS